MSKLSKSLIMRGWQCPKSLWLYTFERSKRKPPDAAQEAIFKQGKMVGNLAQELYPGGKEVPFNTYPFVKKFSLTQHYIDSGCSTIYEATFQHENSMCMVDILYLGPNGWELIEVKSSTSPKPSVIFDIAVQTHIVKGTGLPITKVKLIHINTSYVRGKKLSLDGLFTVVDVTDDVLALQSEVQQLKQKLTNVTKNRTCPSISIGPQCRIPYECDFKSVCWQNIPENSVFEISHLTQKEKFELYYKGVLSFNELPNDYPLTPEQKCQIQCAKSGEKNIDQTAIKSFLDPLYYPLYFLDFESFQSPVPPFPNSRPYQQIPFQYSLHIMNSPFDILSHKEFLAPEGKDPRPKLAQKLVQDIPDHACIVVYNAQFEKSIIEELASLYPKYRTQLLKINSLIVDLMLPFKQKVVYYPEMKGRYSIKSVLPALVPELSYSELEISDGIGATLSYHSLTELTDPKKINDIRDALLKYCKLDTLAMVRILDVLRTLVK